MGYMVQKLTAHPEVLDTEWRYVDEPGTVLA